MCGGSWALSVYATGATGDTKTECTQDSECGDGNVCVKVDKAAPGFCGTSDVGFEVQFAPAELSNKGRKLMGQSWFSFVNWNDYANWAADEVKPFQITMAKRMAMYASDAYSPTPSSRGEMNLLRTVKTGTDLFPFLSFSIYGNNDKEYVLAFKGTDNIREKLLDINNGLSPCSIPNLSCGKV